MVARTKQTKIESLIEALVSILIGYVVALMSQLVIFPLFGIHVSLRTNIWIGPWFIRPCRYNK